MLEAQPPAGEQNTAYTPKGPPDPLLFEEFEGIDTATTRAGVDDKEAYWLDGFMPLGPKRNLRTMPGLSAPIFNTDVNTLAFFDFANIGPNPYAIVITTNGAIVAVNTDTKVATAISPGGTILAPSRTTCAIAQWGSSYILIVAKQTNGYFLWDGTIFYNPGATAPGGGTMPLGIGGTAIETYTGRVWITNDATVFFSAPGSPVDFSSVNGGGNFQSTDSFLRVRFTQLKQTNGFLYLIGDSSINYISGVQTSGSPAKTTFTNQNADPEVGTAWPSTVTVFNRNILFANAFGAHVSYGGAVTKTSEKLDGVYNTAPNFGGIVPSAAKAIVFGKKIWILLLPIIDPITGQQTNKLFCWNQKIWWATEQDVKLTYIQFQEINSILTAYGTDGTFIYQMFAQPSVNFVKRAVTKFWDKPGGYQFTKWVNRFWAIVQYFSNLAPAITVSIDSDQGSVTSTAALTSNLSTWFTNSNLVSTWFTLSAIASVWQAGGSSYAISTPAAVGQNGVLIGFTMSTSAADMTIVSAMMQPGIAGNRG
jgi:hypothetical protein